jgi:hypothetical protein
LEGRENFLKKIRLLTDGAEEEFLGAELRQK